MLPLSGWPDGVRLACLFVWWWFENSRACCTTFTRTASHGFVRCCPVNVFDCQSDVRRVGVRSRGPRGGFAGRRGFLCVTLFLIRGGSFFSFFGADSVGPFHEGFLWRVRFWLRMNAGGVLNTCKSNGIQAACCLVRVANG